MTSSAIVRTGSRVARLRAPLLTGAGVAVATAGLAWANPERRTISLCPLHVITGLWCPACGALRATSALAHADVAHALAMNSLWTVLVPLLIAFWFVWLVRSWQSRPLPPLPQRAWITIFVVVMAFGVLRNIPALSPWLGPAVS